MLARDVMTTPVVAVTPETDVAAVAGLLLESKTSRASSCARMAAAPPT